MISEKPAVITKMFTAMGTVNTVCVADETDPAALDAVRERVTALHQKLSAFDESSEIAGINRTAGTAAAPVSEDTFRLIERCVRYAALTDGRFDITAGPASMLWKRAIKTQTLPAQSEIDAAKARIGFQNILLEPDTRRAGLKKQGQQIDLGGVAKGFAANEAREILTDYGVQDALLNFGGTVVTIGEPKQVGIQNPFSKTGSAFAVIEAENEAVVTSGVYEQGFTAQGRTWHHIVDPVTGLPSDSPFAGMTLIGKDAELLDALATAACILPPEAAFRLVKEQNFGAVFITRERQVLLTDNMKDRVRFL